MEDGNYANVKDDRSLSTSNTNIYGEHPLKFAANGHNAEADSSVEEPHQPHGDSAPDDKYKKRINPLKIHLGKRPFVDSSLQLYNNSSKKKNTVSRRPSDPSACNNVVHRVPKLIPKKKFDNVNNFHNVAPQIPNDVLESEKDKPVPRLVPKSQLLQYKKSAMEKQNQLKDLQPNPGTPAMVKFKCRKCCAMSFKTLAKLKEHQIVCRIQPKEPVSTPQPASTVDDNSGGPSRVTKKVYLCSACGTYYENWNLFLHMREVHNRHICLFCLGMFSKAEKLSAHLMNKHNVQEHSYASKEDFCNIYKGSLYLMCCECDEICSEQDDFYNHDCNKVIPKPVPVLVSKNSARNNMKQSKMNDTINWVSSITRDDKPCDTSKLEKDINPSKTDLVPQLMKQIQNDIKDGQQIDCVTSTGSALTYKDTNSTEDLKKENHLEENDLSTSYPVSSTENKEPLTNGDDPVDYHDRNNSPVPMDVDPPSEVPPVLLERPHPSTPSMTHNYNIATHTDKEKEGGIKLKLSLNNAKAPVIINSTVDPSIGIQMSQKPPSRSRRPPKRYEKAQNSFLPVHPQPRTPSIKMTICDKADSPFVKTTFYENNQETTLQTLLNNNLESSPKSLQKSENLVMSTIYDNKHEDANTLNRVPKLTVRVPKELLDKDSSSDYSSDSDTSEKLTVDDNTDTKDLNINESVTEYQEPESTQVEDTHEAAPLNMDTEVSQESELTVEPISEIKEEPKLELMETDNVDIEKISEDVPVEQIPAIELRLNRPLDKYPLKELLKLFLGSTVYNCIYCNHVRKIAVNCEQLALHMAAEHRFSATVDSITAEELMPETITLKVKSDAEQLRTVFINYDSYDSEEACENNYDYVFECFQCYFKTSVHKDLYLHNRKMHQKTILLCVMCKSNFYSYSELLCHICPGTYVSDCEIKFRCHLCNVDTIPSSFRLMVHLRKIHNSCDVCLEFCHNQARLSNHVWKHKLHHFCYRCGIAYRNKPDITNHLFWKHGTESVFCKKCSQKKWPHVYHFCTPPAVFICDECNLQFSKAVYLKVHKRFHSGEFPHVCIEEGCSEKFVSKKLLMKHLEEHQRKLASENIDMKVEKAKTETAGDESVKDSIPVIDLINDDNEEKSIVKTDPDKPDVKVENSGESVKKSKKKKLKDKDALLLDVNLPELNLSESDSSDDSDSEPAKPTEEVKDDDSGNIEEKYNQIEDKTDGTENKEEKDSLPTKVDDVTETNDEDKPNEKEVLQIWDNFKKFQAKTEKPREKTPPLVPIRKHVCESDHDYCLIPTDLNGDDLMSPDKKKKKKDKHMLSSSSSSSSSDSDSSCSCGSNCSCSSSSDSSSSSSLDSDSSDEPNRMKKKKQRTKTLSIRRLSNGSNVDVMGMSETPVLLPEKAEPQIAETDLETQESETDEEFYDENPQRLANKIFAEKRNQLLLLASVAPSEVGSTGEVSRPTTPVKPIEEKKPKTPGSKKKSKKKKRSKSSRKHAPIKINIPKEVIQKPIESEVPAITPVLAPNKITISLQSNTVQIPEQPLQPPIAVVHKPVTPIVAGPAENKRASKRRRVPNKFYGYSSDEEPSTPTQAAFKPYQPPKLEWRKEDLPSPASHRVKKEAPAPTPPKQFPNYVEPIRLKAPPMPDPEPPRILMNTESMGSSETESSDEGALEIYQPTPVHNAIPVPPPAYLNSGTSSLPYAFQRPAGRQAREGESVYCYCRCPYDEVSEMIACDADGCAIEWFHFECVGIMVPPKGKWYCPECRQNYK